MIQSKFLDEVPAIRKYESRLKYAEASMRDSKELTRVGYGEADVDNGESWKVAVTERNEFGLWHVSDRCCQVQVLVQSNNKAQLYSSTPMSLPDQLAWMSLQDDVSVLQGRHQSIRY